MWTNWFKVAMACAAIATVAAIALRTGAASAAPAGVGCYERVYDAAHLAAHGGQLVTRATLRVRPPSSEETIPDRPMIGELKFWVRGRKKSFDSTGTCKQGDDALHCDGSLSAAEADRCRTKTDGVHENCRIVDNNAGAFAIAAKPNGVLVTVTRWLELVPAPYDSGPFLYLSGNNAENYAFLLRAAPESACAMAP